MSKTLMIGSDALAIALSAPGVEVLAAVSRSLRVEEGPPVDDLKPVAKENNDENRVSRRDDGPFCEIVRLMRRGGGERD